MLYIHRSYTAQGMKARGDTLWSPETTVAGCFGIGYIFHRLLTNRRFTGILWPLTLYRDSTGEEKPCALACQAERHTSAGVLRLATIKHNQSYLTIAPSARKDTHFILPPSRFPPSLRSCLSRAALSFFQIRCSSSLDEVTQVSSISLSPSQDTGMPEP